MISHFKTHFFQYFILLIIVALGAISFIIFIGDKELQFKIILVTSFLYVVWGVVHHFLEKTLYPKIVIEYIAVALLAIVILGGLLK